MMFIIEFKPDIIFHVRHLVLKDEGVLLQLDFVEVQAVHLLSEVVHLGLVELLDFVVVLLETTCLVHDLFAHVVTILFV